MALKNYERCYKVVVCFLTNFIVFGIMNFHETQLKLGFFYRQQGKAHGTSYLNSIGNILAPLIGVVGGILSDRIGYRIVAGLGALLYGIRYIVAGAYFGDALCFLGYGFMTGLGAGLIQIPAISLLPQCCSSRMGLALGLAYSGIGFGMLIPWSPVSTNIRALKISLLKIGGLVVVACGLFSLLLKRPTPANPISLYSTRLSIKTNTRSFNFIVLWLATLVMTFGSSVPVYYLITNNYKYSSTLQFIYTGQAFGAILSGILADRFGSLLVMTTSTFVSGLLCLTLGRIPSETSLAFCISYGVLSSSYLCLLPMVNYRYILYAKPNILCATSNGLLYSAVGLGILVSRTFIIPLMMFNTTNVLLYIMLWSGLWAILSSMLLAMLKLSLHPDYKAFI